MASSCSLLCGLLAIKIAKVTEMKKSYDNLKLFEKLAKKKFKGTPLILDKIRKMSIGEKNPMKFKEIYANQKVQIRNLIEFIHEKKNNVIMAACINPGPLLKLPVPRHVTVGMASEANEHIRHLWQFYDKVKGAKQFIIDFLYPGSCEGDNLPGYCTHMQTENNVSVFVDNPHMKYYHAPSGRGHH